jgi:hypothetical protein
MCIPFNAASYSSYISDNLEVSITNIGVVLLSFLWQYHCAPLIAQQYDSAAVVFQV